MYTTNTYSTLLWEWIKLVYFSTVIPVMIFVWDMAVVSKPGHTAQECIQYCSSGLLQRQGSAFKLVGNVMVKVRESIEGKQIRIRVRVRLVQTNCYTAFFFPHINFAIMKCSSVCNSELREIARQMLRECKFQISCDFRIVNSGLYQAIP